ncbi:MULTISPECIES: hypothetical protein [unclassified Paenibacillus]|uniref:hypothetical protein n=1 Tax=unclassified Paenibacillus TaxID=185978 RepID=UPI0002E688F9|nr:MULTISPECIES: hypothetical protein [unclassified Paenibacillus]ETT30682.1 hypothetical protein C161_27298 [Paenibacillus sp. FSL R5-192]
MQSPERDFFQIKDTDKFKFILEGGTVEELKVGNMLEKEWEYDGKKISNKNLVKILNFIKNITLAD